MKYANLKNYKLNGTCIAIGNFDGVHLGHQFIISTAVEEANYAKLHPTILTFYPHPLEYHNPNVVFQYITSKNQKNKQFKKLNIDSIVTLEYCSNLAQMSPEEFCRKILVKEMFVKKIVVGQDFTFGKNRAGNVATLKNLGYKYKFQVITPKDFQLLTIEGSFSKRISSTWLRKSLLSGNIKEATRILGRYHMIEGTIVHGIARGRTLGFPTANLSPQYEGLAPSDGIYAGWVHVEDTKYPAAISIGFNPTFYKKNAKRKIEAHIINVSIKSLEDFDLYKKHVQIEFVDFIRKMVTYDNVNKLKEQMYNDITSVKNILRNN